MTQLVWQNAQWSKKLDGSVKGSAYAFLEKLTEDDTRPGLNIEPVKNAADPRVRTGRVTDFYRALLFKLVSKDGEPVYVFTGVFPHDDAYDVAARARLSMNSVNGIAELIIAEPTQAPEAEPPASSLEDYQQHLLPSLGISRDDLVERIGITPGLADRALTAITEDDLMTVLTGSTSVPEWQALALVSLGGGTSVDETRAELGIGDEETTPTPTGDTEDERILAGLQHPAARVEFTFIEDDAELRRAIDGQDFAAWRVFLHPEQRKYATAHRNGAFRLTGGAGTGKTVVLLHRARHLARNVSTARILLTTFTTTLADGLKRDLGVLAPDLEPAAELGAPGVFVKGIDAAVNAVLRSAGDDLAPDIEAVLGPRSNKITNRSSGQRTWQEVIDAAGDAVPEDLRSPTFFAAEYTMVVLPHRIRTAAEYYRVRRPGRGVALNRGKRAAVWKVIAAYRNRQSIEGSIDFAEAATIAAEHLNRKAAEGAGRPCDSVLVDEGQDLHPGHWQFLRALVAEGPNDLFIAEDSHQRIYSQRVTLKHYGIEIRGRSRRLALNYRTTRQNLGFAVGVLEGANYTDVEDEPEEARYRSARSGPMPQLISAPSLGEELAAAADVVQGWLDQDVQPETIGILVRDQNQASQVVRGLEERSIKVRLIERGASKAGAPQVMTMHRAKGMEFSRVLIFGAGQGTVPATYLVKGLTVSDREDFLLRERSLLYVAATRARDELVVLWSGEASDLLPSVG